MIWWWPQWSMGSIVRFNKPVGLLRRERHGGILDKLLLRKVRSVGFLDKLRLTINVWT